MNKHLLEMKNIYKSFPGVDALVDVSISLNKGQVLALLGENGAGKSTLIKTLSGVHKADSGEILINGEPVKIDSPLEALRAGVGVIYQEISIVPDMTVAENIFLGREPLRTGLGSVNYKHMYNSAQELLDTLELDLDAHDKVHTLSIAQQQMLEIARVVHLEAKIIVMDEPTSSLTQKEVLKLFEITRNLVSEGIGVIYISHRLEEIYEVADMITVLRDGVVVGTRPVSETTHDELVTMMVGRSFEDFYIKERNVQDEIVLEVKELETAYKPHKNSFNVRKGEVLGFCGLIGSGRTEMMRVLFGVDDMVSGEIYLDGKPVKISSPNDAIDLGFALVPEDRKMEGLVLGNTVGYNISLMSLDKFIGLFGVKSKVEESIIDEQMKSLDVRAYSSHQLAYQLSGGNQQKVVLGKWLTTNPRILILDEPTRGIDVGTKREIYSIMNKLTKQGVSILMVTSDLPEGISMSDRIVVMFEGKVTAILDEHEQNEETVMKYALGIESD